MPGDVLVIIQSRMSSSRLPGKAMLPVGGMASALLCARRAGNTGLPVVVATSDDSSDDMLADMLRQFGVRVVRGALDDVLGRFAKAAESARDDAILVRLTADNMFPDGAFIEEALARFRKSGADYASTMPSEGDRLPYGLACEIFTAGVLREAADKAHLPFEREHVTPWIRAHKKCAVIAFETAEDYGDLRCTMDTLEDYLRVARVFEGLDTVSTPWMNLCAALRRLESGRKIPRVMKQGHAVSRMSLGTVQLGLPYGVANRTGMPDEVQARAVMEAALQQGVGVFDTAAAYGVSEERVGGFLKNRKAPDAFAVTKLSPLPELAGNAAPEDIAAHVRACVFRSCVLHGKSSLDYLLLHRWEHYAAFDGAIRRELLRLKEAGFIGRLGASVYTPRQALEALAESTIEWVQIPFNMLDWRWKKAGFDTARARRPNVIVQARSIYLQGLLAGVPEQYPQVPGYDFAALYARLDEFSARFGRASRIDLACAYARAQGWIDTLVIGAETAEQVVQNAALFHTAPLKTQECAALEAAFAQTPETLLDPSKWWNE